MKQTQIQWVKLQISLNGEITRNQCLSNFISRLSAIIQDLEVEGYTFSTSHRGGDFVYTLLSKPEKPKRFIRMDGELVEVK